jgi:hypothetical protein
VRFAADFEQHCEGQDPALFGSVRYNSTVPTVAPFDGNYPVYRLTIVPGAHGVVAGNGLACGPAQTACVQSLAAIANVVLTAVPDRGYALRGWSGDLHRRPHHVGSSQQPQAVRAAVRADRRAARPRRRRAR